MPKILENVENPEKQDDGEQFVRVVNELEKGRI